MSWVEAARSQRSSKFPNGMKFLVEDTQSKLFSRELSWLAFNERVLEEAADPSNPPLERLKYLVIVSTNLEEFFMVRLPSLFSAPPEKLRDGVHVHRLLQRVREWVYEQKKRQAQLFESLCLELGSHGLSIEHDDSPLAREVFEDKVLPLIGPQRIPEGTPLPHLRGGKLYLLAKHANSHSLIDWPTELPRLLIVKTKHVFLVDRLIALYKESLFKNVPVQEIFAFKISRDAGFEVDEEADDPLLELEQQIQSRDKGDIVRMEVDSLTLSESVKWLQAQLKVDTQRLFQISLPLDLKAFIQIYNIRGFKKLRFPMVEAKRPAALPKDLPRQKFFHVLDKKDVLLHHPFYSFDPVVELVQHAAHDSRVTRICQTLYRTSGDSPLVEALMYAAQNKKSVTALVEIKARFDESNNIRWARALERAGVRVVYGTPEIKIHAKLTYVEKKSPKGPMGYVHIGTGNYHPKTARLYTDLGLLTRNPAYTQDAKFLFDSLESMDAEDDFSRLTETKSFSQGFSCWSVAPDNLHSRIVEWIDNETQNALQGKASGIRAKMNGLVEESVIEALYRASNAGVKIDLIVRGMCCVRPGVPGLSENIRVRSLVDRYLEHSRFFIFENGGERQAWLSSADWMPRNFFRRIEIAVPILNPKIVEYLSSVVWERYNTDNSRMRICDTLGEYHRLAIPHDGKEYRAQSELEQTLIPDFSAL